jgi:hypothetical protein
MKSCMNQTISKKWFVVLLVTGTTKNSMSKRAPYYVPFAEIGSIHNQPPPLANTGRTSSSLPNLLQFFLQCDRWYFCQISYRGLGWLWLESISGKRNKRGLLLHSLCGCPVPTQVRWLFFSGGCVIFCRLRRTGISSSCPPFPPH